MESCCRRVGSRTRRDCVNGEDQAAVIAVTLLLSQMRSMFAVGRGLAAKFPTEESWQAFLQSPIYDEVVTEFAQCVADIRDMAQLGPALSPQEVQNAVASHYPRALDAVQELAELVEVPGEDILAVLITA